MLVGRCYAPQMRKEMNFLDIKFDYRNDTFCGDPDIDSVKLYEAHKILWTKTLPSNKQLEISIVKDSYGRLLLKNNQYMNFSSDRMYPHFDGKYNGIFDGWLLPEEIETLKYKVRTVGGHIIFPAHRKGGFTINQSRGVNRKISDRFDLTLECIKRYYNQEQSPLYNTLLRYKDFFDLFVSFKNYIDFFLLQDFVDDEFDVKFSLPFDNFNRTALPQNCEEYKIYKGNIIEMIDKRNLRILNYLNNTI